MDLDDGAPDHRVGAAEIDAKLIGLVSRMRSFEEGDIVDIAGPGRLPRHPGLLLGRPQRRCSAALCQKYVARAAGRFSKDY